MSTILLIAALTITFIIGMTIVMNDLEFDNAVRYSSLSAAVNNNYNSNVINGNGYTIDVSFSGAINKKTKITIESGTSMATAIERAGGLTSSADERAINLNYAIENAGSFYIPKISDKTKICINDSTAEDLTVLPGIGAVTASKIIEYRNQHNEFYYLEELKKISGIGTVTFDNLKDLITLW